MTAREKYIIETILADAGLEPLYEGANDQEPKPKPKPITGLNHRAKSEYSVC
ncbi:MAG: hypothetical protein P4L59_20695 [Desulfosporosinus sp.]|nr:hypothetical protein [Desulfosporosinus sp.]